MAVYGSVITACLLLVVRMGANDMSTNTVEKKWSLSLMIQWATVFLVPIIIWFIPTNQLFSQPMKIFFMITTAGILVLAFEFFDYGLAAMFIPAFYTLSGIVPAATAYSGYVSNIPWLVLGALLLTEVLDETGLLKRISYWCILKCGGTYKGIIWGIFLAGLILTLMTSGSANFLLPALCYGICRSLSLEKSKEAAVIMFAGCISTISTTPLVYKPAFMGLALGGARTVLPDLSVSWIGYFYHNLPNIVFCIFLIFLLFLVFRPKCTVDGTDYFKAEYNKLGAISAREKKAFMITIGLLLFLLTASFHHIAMEWGFVLVPWLFLLPGINCATSQTVHRVNFSMVLFIGSCLCIGSVSAALGVGDLISQTISPLLKNLSTMSVLAIVWLMAFLINFVLTPLAACGALSGPLTQIALDLGINPLVMIYTLIGSMDQLLLPYEYASYAIFFAFGLMSVKHFAKFMAIKACFHFIFLMLVLGPWWYFIGLL